MVTQPDPKSEIKRKANAMRKTLAQLDKLTGQNFVVARRADAAKFFGVSVQALDKWIQAGMPGTRNAYDLHKIVLWLRTEGPWRQRVGCTGGTVEDLDVESPESEWSEEYRKWKARIAELDYQERAGELVSVARATHVWVDVVMPEVRQFAERVIRAHGNGTADDWRETCERIDGAIEREFSNGDNQERPAILAADENSPVPGPAVESSGVDGSQDPPADGAVRGPPVSSQPAPSEPPVV
jgi:phage terminase Nu1 subunit (DNA packaging protein)